MSNKRIQKVLNDRYLQPGEWEDDMYKRVADLVADGNKVLAHEFYTMMSNKWFLPNTPLLVNGGVPGNEGCYSACFVLPIEDSRNGIYNAAHQQSAVHTAFGGTGFDLDPIRPKDSLIKGTGGKSCGVVEVVRFLNASSRMIRQGGKREGGNMGCLSFDHGDIHDFVTCKTKGGELEDELCHFNLSVKVTDEFMKSADEIGSVDHSLLNGIVHQMWESGDPGLVFIDTMNKYNQVPGLGEFSACNVCGEQPLLPYEACNLGSINLSLMVTEDGEVNYELLGKVIETATIFLDMVIDVNVYPLPEIKNMVIQTRKIGLGPMGLHDFLIKRGVAYDSKEGRKEAAEIMEFITDRSVEVSHERALEVGSFPAIDVSIWGSYAMRNAATTTIAPTGSISLIADCSSGAEPVFAWEYTQEIEAGTFTVKHPTYNIAKVNRLLQTTYDISPKDHVDMLIALQRYVHSAVSKTVNLPKDATEEDIRNIIMRAWKGGCKGITVYRDGSKDKQVLRTLTKPMRSGMTIVPVVKTGHPGRTDPHVTGCGTMLATINHVSDENDQLYEVIINSNGGCSANNEAIGRLISLGFQHGIPSNEISGTLHCVKCTTAMKSSKSEGKSCADIIAKAIDKYTGTGTVDTSPKCPECDKPLMFREGCGLGTCPDCGWSGCN